MTKKRYHWSAGAKLDDHSKRKHKILREYLRDYLKTRCAFPKQERFRLAIVDGFSGAGRYADGNPGSPIIILEELKDVSISANILREMNGFPKITFEIFIAFNDADPEAVELLTKNLKPILAEIYSEAPNLKVNIEKTVQPFEVFYPALKQRLQSAEFRNVFFNLDQYGHSDVRIEAISDMMRSFNSVEVLYTFSIQALLAFLPKSDHELLSAQLQRFSVSLADFGGGLNNVRLLGTAEQLVFKAFQDCASFVSPFSIHNPSGWRYWLIHFANSYRARQVYNDVLHRNSSAQAHFGRSGLNMLSYNPSDEGQLYLFDEVGRISAKEQLMQDIPRLIVGFGDSVPVLEFYGSIYNSTPAHSDDIHAAIIDSTEIEVVTPKGNLRRKAETISVEDVLRLPRQGTLFSLLERKR